MPEWRAYYDDGSSFSSDDGKPHEAPPEGFICAVGYDESGKRYILHGWNYVHWDRESSQWWGMDEAGLRDRLRRNLVYAYKEGRTVTRTVFEEIMQRAHEDKDFPLT